MIYVNYKLMSVCCHVFLLSVWWWRVNDFVVNLHEYVHTVNKKKLPEVTSAGLTFR